MNLGSNQTKSIAIYGYGVFGRRTSESFLRYWGGEYTVTAIFDNALAGIRDEYWGLTVLSPAEMKAEFCRGTFETVMVCIMHRATQNLIMKNLSDLGIPFFFPGKAEDFSGPESFQQDEHLEITVSREDYSVHVYKNMYVAVADYNRSSFLFKFNEKGLLNIDNFRKYIHDYERYLLSYPFRLRDPLPEKVYMKGSYCNIVKSFPGNYWHFTFETADCVYLMEKAGYKGKYIYDEEPFSREFLQVMGIDPARLVSTRSLDLHKVYVTERLIDINYRGLIPTEISTDVAAEMSGFIRKQLKSDDSSPKRIYVKRIGSRKLLNGEDTALKNGFTVIVPENYSIREQMNLFGNADIVLCPHGANSTNFLYMRSGSVFVEIFSDKWYIKYINRNTCRAIGVHYLELKGKAFDFGPDNEIIADYVVDEEAFQQIILEAERILNDKE